MRGYTHALPDGVGVEFGYGDNRPPNPDGSPPTGGQSVGAGYIWFRFLDPKGHDSRWYQCSHRSSMKAKQWLTACLTRDEAFTALTEF